MRFADFLRSTVLAATVGATALILATLAGVSGHDDPQVMVIALGWWIIATILGAWWSRDGAISDAIGTLLADARTQASLPEIAPARTFLNRLWPLLVATVAAAALALLWPQVPAVVAGFLILGAVAWGRQPAAVRAIEDRDGARFYVDRTRFFQPIRLIRTPGFRATLVEMPGVRRGAH